MESGKHAFERAGVKPGDTVKVGQVIGSVDTEAAGAPDTKKEPATPAPQVPPAKPEKQPAPPESLEKPQPSHPVRIKIEESLAKSSSLPSLPQPSKEPQETKVSGQETRKKMTKLRRTIAQRLVEVKNQTAMLTTFNEVDMSAVMQVRAQEQENFQKKHGVKLGFMSFFVKACVAALQQYPDINGRIEGDEIVYNQRYDIGVAVGTEKGLMVPVIRGADLLSYADIEKKLKEFADKARNGTIAIEDLQGGWISSFHAYFKSSPKRHFGNAQHCQTPYCGRGSGGHPSDDVFGP